MPDNPWRRRAFLRHSWLHWGLFVRGGNRWLSESSLIVYRAHDNALATISPSFSGDDAMTISGIAQLQPVVALIAGILILIMPRLLNFIVAIYLIFVGIVGLGILR
jgi:hypothetical protein